MSSEMKDSSPLPWIPIDPPKPKDEGLYDILLDTGKIVSNVEFWRFGGGFCVSPDSGVKYPLDSVIAFRDWPPRG